jgi:AcrR family transcriptional regulator
MLLLFSMTDRNTVQLNRTHEGTEERVSARAAKKERTRSLLIEAAADVITERGFHAASLMEIASRAGLTTGAVYSNFMSKEALFLAVIRELAIAPDLGLDSSSAWERLGEAAAVATRGLQLPESRRLLKLQLEFALLTIQDNSLKDEFVDELRADRKDLSQILKPGDPAPRPAFNPSSEQLATVVIATVQGLQQHRFMDGDAVPEELARWAVQALLHVALNEQSREEKA